MKKNIIGLIIIIFIITFSFSVLAIIDVDNDGKDEDTTSCNNNCRIDRCPNTINTNSIVSVDIDGCSCAQKTAAGCSGAWCCPVNKVCTTDGGVRCVDNIAATAQSIAPITNYDNIDSYNKESTSCKNATCSGYNSILTSVENGGTTASTKKSNTEAVCCDGNWWIDTKGDNWNSLCNGKGLELGGWYKSIVSAGTDKYGCSNSNQLTNDCLKKDNISCSNAFCSGCNSILTSVENGVSSTNYKSNTEAVCCDSDWWIDVRGDNWSSLCNGKGLEPGGWYPCKINDYDNIDCYKKNTLSCNNDICSGCNSILTSVENGGTTASTKKSNTIAVCCDGDWWIDAKGDNWNSLCNGKSDLQTGGWYICNPTNNCSVVDTSTCTDNFCSGCKSILTSVENGGIDTNYKINTEDVCCDGNWWIDAKGDNWNSLCNGKGLNELGGWYKSQITPATDKYGCSYSEITDDCLKKDGISCSNAFCSGCNSVLTSVKNGGSGTNYKSNTEAVCCDSDWWIDVRGDNWNSLCNGKGLEPGGWYPCKINDYDNIDCYKKNTLSCNNDICSGCNSILTSVENGGTTASTKKSNTIAVCCDGDWWIDAKGDNWNSLCNGKSDLQTGGWYICNPTNNCSVVDTSTCTDNFCSGCKSILTSVENKGTTTASTKKSNADLGAVCCDYGWEIDVKEDNWKSKCNGKEGLQPNGWYICNPANNCSTRDTATCTNNFCSGCKSVLTSVKNEDSSPNYKSNTEAVCCDGNWWIDTKGNNWNSSCNEKGLNELGGWYKSQKTPATDKYGCSYSEITDDCLKKEGISCSNAFCSGCNSVLTSVENGGTPASTKKSNTNLGNVCCDSDWWIDVRGDNWSSLCNGKGLEPGGWYICNNPTTTTPETPTQTPADCTSQEAFVTINARYSDHKTIAKRAIISIDGIIKSTYRGKWSGCLPKGQHTIHFGDINDGEWKTLGNIDSNLLKENEKIVTYCYEEYLIDKNVGCGNNAQMMDLSKEFSSYEGESGTAWLVRNLIYPDAKAPADQVINVQSEKTNSFIAEYNEHDYYYTMSEKGLTQLLGYLPLANNGGVGSGTTEWDGRKFTFRSTSGNYNWNFARVKAKPAKVWTSGLDNNQKIIWYPNSEALIRYHLFSPHATTTTDWFINNQTRAVFWAVGNQSIGYQLEEVKETCSPISYGEWYPACSPDKLFVKEAQDNTHGIPVPASSVCDKWNGNKCDSYIRSNYYCLNPPGKILIPPSTVEEDTKYTLYRFGANSKKCEGNSYCKDAQCVSPTIENRNSVECVKKYCEGINSKLTSVENGGTTASTKKSNAAIGHVCCDKDWWIDVIGDNWMSECNGKEGLQLDGWYICNPQPSPTILDADCNTLATVGCVNAYCSGCNSKLDGVRNADPDTTKICDNAADYDNKNAPNCIGPGPGPVCCSGNWIVDTRESNWTSSCDSGNWVPCAQPTISTSPTTSAQIPSECNYRDSTSCEGASCGGCNSTLTSVVNGVGTCTNSQTPGIGQNNIPGKCNGPGPGVVYCDGVWTIDVRMEKWESTCTTGWK